MKYFTSAILLAGGNGSRFGSETPKQFLPLGSKLIIHYSLDLLLHHSLIDEIIIVCDPKYRHYFTDYTDHKIRFAPPGQTRQESVHQGMLRASADAQLICIHDSARPLLNKIDLDLILEEGIHSKAAALATHAKNTIKEVRPDHSVIKTLDRAVLWEIQTPQVLAAPILWAGLAYAEEHKITVTDDISLAELVGHKSKIVPGSQKNIKITSQEDMTIALAFLDQLYAQV
ncbi:MAG: 2-C-methyl-D-erythritol 4-phosphate cytidylyltransferase [Chlamydiia bacterium]|nr:2-C-methyl-D-erythritol 4-phosphate cytidylyltransferase [Chlamydiia bacterium]